MAFHVNLLNQNCFKAFRNFSRLRSVTINHQLKFKSRLLSTTATNYVKEIKETTDDKVTVVEGVFYESPRKDTVIPIEAKDDGCCYMCKLNLDLQHTDVLILSQFVSSTGEMLPQHVTGLCGAQHRIVENLIRQAFKAGLMKNFEPNRPFRPFETVNRYFSGNKITYKVRQYK